MTPPESFFIGIDTGGTYTDAVIIAHDTQKILGRAKALTTKGDLSIGVKEALTTVMQTLPVRCKVFRHWAGFGFNNAGNQCRGGGAWQSGGSVSHWL